MQEEHWQPKITVRPDLQNMATGFPRLNLYNKEDGWAIWSGLQINEWAFFAKQA